MTAPTTQQLYTHIIDAATGRVLYRQSLVDYDSGKAWDYYPGAAQGRHADDPQPHRPRLAAEQLPRSRWQRRVTCTAMSTTTTSRSRREEITPSGPKQFNYPFTSFNSLGGAARPSSCSWDPAAPYSWQTNRAQNAVQVMYFLGNYHDHLVAKPIGFTRAAGNFEAVDGDAVAGRDVGRREHRERVARPEPRRQRQHGHAAGRHLAAHADVPVPAAGHARTTRSCRATAATRRTSSTTSTPTACPTVSSSTRWVLHARQRRGRVDG